MFPFLIVSCSWFLVPESPSVWYNVRHCFLLRAHVHLTQGKLAVKLLIVCVFLSYKRALHTVQVHVQNENEEVL